MIIKKGKIEIFGFVISKASRVKLKLETVNKEDANINQYYYVRGLYDSRIFGLCIYRLHNSAGL